jgi:hypothetical protein
MKPGCDDQRPAPIASRPGHASSGLLATLAALPGPASAHGFGALYNLPVPFWLYAWGAVAALLVSFLLAAFFATSASGARGPSMMSLYDRAWARTLRRGLPVLRAASVMLLALCIATGWLGNRDPYRNFNMTFFWVLFVLGLTYLTALVGNVFALCNPWRVLAEWLLRGRLAAAPLRYPQALGEWPALALYLGFIGFELFGHSRPDSLATALAFYTVLNLVGAWLIGTQHWFGYCEPFSVFLRMTGLLAPIGIDPDALEPHQRLVLRMPFAGLLQQRPASLGGMVFALAMLATTAFDGLKATQWWVNLFWKDPTGWVTTLAGARPIMRYAQLRPWYVGWETFWLLASPLIYSALYLLCIALAKGLTRTTHSFRVLTLAFGYSLLPIAFVYHLTHYSTLLLSQGVKIVSLASDPFGWGWDLFGTAQLWRAPILPSMALVWHAQVGLILFGHIVSVAMAHRIALGFFPRRRQALASQLPMLTLMVLFTVAGLWILAQPLTTERMR